MVNGGGGVVVVDVDTFTFFATATAAVAVIVASAFVVVVVVVVVSGFVLFVVVRWTAVVVVQGVLVSSGRRSTTRWTKVQCNVGNGDGSRSRVS